MYFLYLDDSGSIANIDEHHFVLGGFCIHVQQIYHIRKYLDDLAESLFPTNPETVEFHASHIYAGNGPWGAFKKSQRIEIIRRVLGALQCRRNIAVSFACAIHKPDFPTKNAVEFAFEDLCSRFEMFLSRMYHQTKAREKGIIILDKTVYETSLQQLAITFRQSGTTWRTLANIVEVPMFIESTTSRLIQLADHIAYATFRRFQRCDTTYFDVIQRLFDTDERGIIHGLEHKHHTLQCACTGCMRPVSR
jgi:hypothetical protein